MPAERKVTNHQLIWERLPEKSALNREQIVQTAIAIADVEGAQGITMRRIATELDAGAMSLYRHVFSKDDLLDLMIDDVFGEIVLPEPHADEWRSALAALASATRAVFKRHPWLSTVLNSRPTLGPNYMRWFERSLAIVADLNLDSATMVQIVGALYGYVGGVVSYELAEQENTRRTGLTEEDKRAYATPYVQQIIANGQHPNFARFFVEGVNLDPDQSFAFGLSCLLDGFAMRIAEQHATQP